VTFPYGKQIDAGRMHIAYPTCFSRGEALNRFALPFKEGTVRFVFFDDDTVMCVGAESEAFAEAVWRCVRARILSEYEIIGINARTRRL